MFLLHVVQGGVYLFQLIDYYGANGACILFVSLVQCVAVGWAFGKWYQNHVSIILSFTIFIRLCIQELFILTIYTRRM